MGCFARSKRKYGFGSGFSFGSHGTALRLSQNTEVLDYGSNSYGTGFNSGIGCGVFLSKYIIIGAEITYFSGVSKKGIFDSSNATVSEKADMFLPELNVRLCTGNDKKYAAYVKAGVVFSKNPSGGINLDNFMPIPNTYSSSYNIGVGYHNRFGFKAAAGLALKIDKHVRFTVEADMLRMKLNISSIGNTSFAQPGDLVSQGMQPPVTNIFNSFGFKLGFIFY